MVYTTTVEIPFLVRVPGLYAVCPLRTYGVRQRERDRVPQWWCILKPPDEMFTSLVPDVHTSLLPCPGPEGILKGLGDLVVHGQAVAGLMLQVGFQAPLEGVPKSINGIQFKHILCDNTPAKVAS